MNEDNDTTQPTVTPQLSPPVEETGRKKASLEQTRRELDAAVRGSGEVICEISTPFQLTPVTVTLDRAKITASKRRFTATTSLMSLPLADVLNVTSETGFMFGYVKIDKQILAAEDPFRYGPFWRKDAIIMAGMAQGYIVALQRQIDLSPLPLAELKAKLLELGSDKNVSPTDPLP
jgi:hypothetical protein